LEYRRARIEGGTYFFTVVIYERKRILCTPENVELLRQVVRDVMRNHPFKIEAFVLLPDHLHTIWTLPEDDHDFSTRWRLIKSSFSRGCRDEFKSSRTVSRRKKHEQAIWQRRFWEHRIRDEEDSSHHVEYIHYNPVRHGLAVAPKDWEYSSFHRYVGDGVYDIEWGGIPEVRFDSAIGSE
jgi:putative transposase